MVSRRSRGGITLALFLPPKAESPLRRSANRGKVPYDPRRPSCVSIDSDLRLRETVRMEVNVEAARRKNLQISAKLLNLAQIVK